MGMREDLKTSLSYDALYVSSMSVDWDKLRGEDSEGVEIVLPPITVSVLEEYDLAPEFDDINWLEENIEDHISDVRLSEIAVQHGEDPEDVISWLAEQNNWRRHLTTDEVAAIQEALVEARAEFFDPDDGESPLAAAIEKFRYSQEYYEWQDRFEPMMDFIWPVNLAYGVTDEEAAGLIDKYAGSTSLVYVRDLDTHAIVLTGGGMDLTWDIATAYLCCGCIPPLLLLSALPKMCETYRERHRILLTECVTLAAEALMSRAKRMVEDAGNTVLWFYDNMNKRRNFRTSDGYLLTWARDTSTWTSGDLTFQVGAYGVPIDAAGQPLAGTWESVPAPSAA